MVKTGKVSKNAANEWLSSWSGLFDYQTTIVTATNLLQKAGRKILKLFVAI